MSSTKPSEDQNFIPVDMTVGEGVATTWKNVTSTCVNALHSLHYTITYNTKGHITAVGAKIEYTNITLSSPLFVKQTFEVKFIPESSGEGVTIRPRSGNPGYRMGSNVLGAIFVPSHSNTSFSYHLDVPENGITIMDSGRGGMCESVSVSGTVRE